MLRALSAHPVQGAHRVVGPPRKALGLRPSPPRRPQRARQPLLTRAFKEGEAREQEEKEKGQAAPPAPAKQAPGAEQAPAEEEAPPPEQAPGAEQAGPASSVTFAVKHHVEWTQKVKVVGSPQVLGAWDCVAAPEMLWGEGDSWSITVELPPGRHEFKLVVSKKGECFDWEGGANRVVEVPDPLAAANSQGALAVECEWAHTEGMLAHPPQGAVPHLGAPKPGEERAAVEEGEGGDGGVKTDSDEAEAWIEDMSGEPSGQANDEGQPVAVGKMTLPGGKEARDARVAPVSEPTERGEAPKQAQRQQAQQGAQQGQQQPPLRAAVQKAQAKAEKLMAKHGTGKEAGRAAAAPAAGGERVAATTGGAQHSAPTQQDLPERASHKAEATAQQAAAKHGAGQSIAKEGLGPAAAPAMGGGEKPPGSAEEGAARQAVAKPGAEKDVGQVAAQMAEGAGEEGGLQGERPGHEVHAAGQGQPSSPAPKQAAAAGDDGPKASSPSPKASAGAPAEGQKQAPTAPEPVVPSDRPSKSPATASSIAESANAPAAGGLSPSKDWEVKEDIMAHERDKVNSQQAQQAQQGQGEGEKKPAGSEEKAEGDGGGRKEEKKKGWFG